MKRYLLIPFFLSTIFFLSPLEGARSHLVEEEFTKNNGYVLRDGKLVDKRDVATLSVQEHYNKGVEALQEENWQEAAFQFRIVSSAFPDTAFGKEAHFYLGVAYAKLGEYEGANRHLSDYLREQPNGNHFVDCLEYKLHVADAFSHGAKRHLFGYDKLPKWLPGDKVALSAYDEIVELAPSHELAAKSLHAKAKYLITMRRYVEAVDACQTLIHRFPKHELVPDAFLVVADAFYRHCKEEENNPDLLPLAEINLKRFRNLLPREERIAEVEEKITQMREICANALFKTAQFYERTKHPKASVLYYVTALKRFPNTSVAQQCRQRLHNLEEVAVQMNFSKELWL